MIDLATPRRIIALKAHFKKTWDDDAKKLHSEAVHLYDDYSNGAAGMGAGAAFGLLTVIGVIKATIEKPSQEAELQSYLHKSADEIQPLPYRDHLAIPVNHALHNQMPQIIIENIDQASLPPENRIDLDRFRTDVAHDYHKLQNIHANVLAMSGSLSAAFLLGGAIIYKIAAKKIDNMYKTHIGTQPVAPA